MRRTSQFPSVLTFFGLTPEYRQNLFSQIHEIVFHGKGGYDFHTVYNMPIWLRNFTFKKLEEMEADLIIKTEDKVINKYPPELLQLIYKTYEKHC